MRGIEIPDEFPGHISCGEFGKGIITLDLDSIYCRLPTLTSMILSLPDLKKLRIKHYGAIPEGPLPTCPVTPGRGPLDSLELLGHVDEIGEALAESRLTSRHLSLDVSFTNVGQLLSLSSETAVELKLWCVVFMDSQTGRDNDGRSSRYFNQWDSPSHQHTTVARPYHSSCRPSCVYPLASPYKHPLFHRLSSSVIICRYRIQLETRETPLSEGSVG